MSREQLRLDDDKSINYHVVRQKVLLLKVTNQWEAIILNDKLVL